MSPSLQTSHHISFNDNGEKLLKAPQSKYNQAEQPVIVGRQTSLRDKVSREETPLLEVTTRSDIMIKLTR